MDADMLTETARLSMKQLGEPVVYVKSDGTEREILAVVERGTPDTMPEPPQGVPSINFTGYVVNEAKAIGDNNVGGISVDELNTGGDALKVDKRVGGSKETRSISQLLSQDGGMLTLGIR